MSNLTLDDALSDMLPEEGSAPPSPTPLDPAASNTSDLDTALSDMGPETGNAEPATPEQEGPAEPALTEEQKALTPGYYVEHGEPGLGHPNPGPFALAEAAEGGLLGAYSGMLEVKDLFRGEPAGGRPDLDQAQREIEERSPLIGGPSIAIGQFAIGMFGLGKFAAAAKAMPWFGRGLMAAEGSINGARGGEAALEVGKSGAAMFLTSDPHSERLPTSSRTRPSLGRWRTTSRPSPTTA